MAGTEDVMHRPPAADVGAATLCAALRAATQAPGASASRLRERPPSAAEEFAREGKSKGRQERPGADPSEWSVN
jgi:hypothetical protein